ncbi:MAG: hypothetical protein WC122_03320 [archaeon]
MPIEVEVNEKIPRKKSYLIKFRQQKINPNCLKQNEIRKEFTKTLPKEMIPFEDSEYGIDYYYNGISIDQKFCFGDLGKNTIKIRVRKKQLLNKSDWTMIINENKEIIFFDTQKLKEFVKKNWSLVQKNFVSKKLNYSEHFIKIKDFCRIEKTELIKTKMNKEEIKNTLKELSIIKEKYFIEESLTKNKTVLNYSKKICFEPFLVNFAKQNNYS